MELQDAHDLATTLMQYHGVDPRFSFRFDKATRRFGATTWNWDKEARAYVPGDISLSKALTLLNDESVVAKIVLHEIAHARVGAGHNHDAVWKREARRIGADAHPTYSTSSVNTLPKKERHIEGHCPKHGLLTKRYARRNGATHRGCGLEVIWVDIRLGKL